MSEENWREQVLERLHGLDWQAIRNDVRAFVEPGFDLNLLMQENLARLLG